MSRNRRGLSEMEKANCPKCGQEVELGGMTFEENVMRDSDHRVIATSRKFKPVCPKCGPIPNVHRIGHHGTIATKRMKALFPKRYLKRSARSFLAENNGVLTTSAGDGTGRRKEQ